MTPPMTWRDRSAQWARFSAWESRTLHNRFPDFQRTLKWASDAWSLARRLDPDWASERRAIEHVDQIARVRAALAHLPQAR